MLGLLAGALVLASGLTGCGDDAPGPTTTDSPSSPAASSPPPSAASPDPSGGAATPVTVDLGGRRLAGFTAQDGAIACLFDRTGGVESVRCDVPDNSWSAPEKPADCVLDWGHAVGLSADASGGRFLCVGDTVLGIRRATDGSNELAPGTLATYGVLACLVQPNGVSCYETTTGVHSLFVTPLTFEVV